jgi:hypothetical protein
VVVESALALSSTDPPPNEKLATERWALVGEADGEADGAADPPAEPGRYEVTTGLPGVGRAKGTPELALPPPPDSSEEDNEDEDEGDARGAWPLRLLPLL